MEIYNILQNYKGKKNKVQAKEIPLPRHNRDRRLKSTIFNHIKSQHRKISHSNHQQSENHQQLQKNSSELKVSDERESEKRVQ